MDELSKDQNELLSRINKKTGLGVSFDVCNRDAKKHYIITLGWDRGHYRNPNYVFGHIIHTVGNCIAVGLTIEGLFENLSHRKELH